MPSSEDLAHAFPGLSKEAGKEGLIALYAKMDLRELAAGEHVIEFGRAADSVFFLLFGRLTVSLPIDNQLVEVGSYGPGSIVGEVAVLDPAPAGATVMAGEASVVLGLKRSALLTLETEQPRAASAVLHTLSHALAARTRAATDQLDALRGDTPAPQTGVLGALRALIGLPRG